MLQSPSVAQSSFGDGRAHNDGLASYIAIVKRRLFHFLIPFVLLLGIGAVVVLVQRPIYLAEGKILVESQEIPTDLVRPTVTDSANQRIQIIQQRIMTRDNLLGIINKYLLFPSQRQWMSGTQLFDLMRERTTIKLIELNRTAQPNNLTVAVNLGFEYEDPTIAMRVANEFLTLILNEDARTRTDRAAATTKFLAREAKRLEGELGAIDAQAAEFRRHLHPTNSVPDQISVQLAALKAELAQKSAVYSATHPTIKALNRSIAALEQTAASTPPAVQGGAGLDELERQRTSIEKSLEEANKKLSAARLGESLERDQQSERLQVIEQPAVPQKPLKPNRLKLFALAFTLAGMAGACSVFVAESLDRSIRNARELASVIDSHLIVTLPYIVTDSEARRRKLKWKLLIGIPVVVIVGVLATAYFLDAFGDLTARVDQSWIDTLQAMKDRLTRLSK